MSKPKNTKKKKSKKDTTDDTTDDRVPLQNDKESQPNFSLKFDDNELNELFEKFLDDLEIKGDKRIVMLKIDSSIKSTMLSTNTTVKSSTPKYYVELLNQILNNRSSMTEEKIAEKLESVWISLKSYKVSWLKLFYEPPNDGIKILCKVLESVNSQPDLALLCLRCFRAFGNCGFGFFKLIEDKDAQFWISTWLRPGYPALMSVAVDILALLVFYSMTSHSNVLEALDRAAKFNNYENRFTPLIQGAEKHLVDEKEPLSLACVRFINVIVNPNFRERDNAPLSLYYSLHLRREMITFGLGRVFTELQKHDDIPDIQKLIDMFLEDTDYLAADSREETDNLILSFGDSDEIFRLLKLRLRGTVSELSLQSILGTLLIIKDDPRRDRIFHFIDKINAEIILQNDTEDFCPDPTMRTFNGVYLKKIMEANVLDDLDAARTKLAAQKAAFDDLKRQFIAYKVDNPSKVEPNTKGKMPMNTQSKL